MTETAKLRARYARLYAAGIFTLLAITVCTAVWTSTPSQPVMDASTHTSGTDTASLPKPRHVDAF